MCAFQHDNWISTSISLEQQDKYCGVVAYSPSQLFALICFNREFQYTDLISTKVIVWNLFNNKLNRILHMKEWTNICYRYWLGDDVFVIFNQDTIARCYTQFVYFCDFNDPNSQPILINERFIPFLSSTVENAKITCGSMDACMITINNHDFLFVKSAEYLLCAYDITKNRPHLPPLQMNTRMLNGNSENDEIYWSSSGFVFAYKDIIYYVLNDQSCKYHMDCFAQVKLIEYDLQKRNIIFDNEARKNKTMFQPRKLNEGKYEYYMDGGCKIRQAGCMVLLYNRIPAPDRRLWVLDLEKRTIMEKLMNDYKFDYITLYKGFLQLWDTDNDELVTKYVFMNDHVPRLSDICTIKLMYKK